jgi:fructan beta-fructosidase
MKKKMETNKSMILSVLVLICSVNFALSLYNENFRPQLHYSPPKSWMNDPNGLVYHKETYHLFYQYFPNSTKWGPMHWGHATSKDLFHWTTLPIALYPNDHEYIFSGSAIMDYNNVTGFQTHKENITMIAIFTSHGKTDNVEKQSLAYSNDNGITWTQNPKNPIIDNPKIRDFRDPKILRYHNSHYVIVLAAGDHVNIYKSTNMKEWTLASEFGHNPAQGSHQGVWECPDLFPMHVDINGSVEYCFKLIFKH